MHRNYQLGAGLFLFDVEDTVSDVLHAHTDHVAPPLPRAEQEGYGKSRASAYRVLPLELRDLVISPAMVACSPSSDCPDLAGGIVGTQADLNGMPHHNPQRHAQSVRGARLLGPRGHEPDDMLAPQVCNAPVAMFLAQSLDRAAVGSLRGWPQRAKFR